MPIRRPLPQPHATKPGPDPIYTSFRQDDRAMRMVSVLIANADAPHDTLVISTAVNASATSSGRADVHRKHNTDRHSNNRRTSERNTTSPHNHESPGCCRTPAWAVAASYQSHDRRAKRAGVSERLCK